MGMTAIVVPDWFLCLICVTMFIGAVKHIVESIAQHYKLKKIKWRVERVEGWIDGLLTESRDCIQEFVQRYGALEEPPAILLKLNHHLNLNKKEGN